MSGEEKAGHPPPYYLVLLHFPVCNKNGEVVTTAVANMDVHDIARAARTYGVQRYYIVTPLKAQKRLVEKILAHWQEGYGAEFNPSRREAFQRVCVKTSLDEVLTDVAGQSGKRVRLVVTGAGLSENTLTCKALRDLILCEEDAYVLIFGTGWGLSAEVLDRADYRLAAVKGASDYNHLSVRSAVSILLDRLWGR
ncbi:hypothetical protein SAMN04489760_11757 [Syntrophus gentianae]|uniref:tRNA (guanine-N(1)-)-methyltransferase C-terminal domain-containing protein n=1 Tax=Syntrophus gentianae TaxID=43775 RepID=A0A1H7YS13_9BACT|nr:RNA methyltransferase [Syntrophus gentianae]SEM47999.1 hypothetical protein SAMN04489760_11757 [Syntrophus gentianae]